MSTEVWLRNPQLFIREALEANAFRWSWDIGFLLKKHVDVNRFADLYAPATDWRQLVIGNATQGALELRPGSTMSKPHAIHPIWEYGGNFNTLKKLLKSGEHSMIVLTQLPNMLTFVAKDFMRAAAELQADYEDVKLMPHGLYTYAKTFGLDFGATDVEPRSDAALGKVILPTGKKVQWQELKEYQAWVNLLNMRVSDLAVPRMRCIFNIKSALWAGQHFLDIDRFQATFDAAQVVDDEAIDDPPLPETKSILLKKN